MARNLYRARGGVRDAAPSSTRIRGANDIRYDPGRPLRMPSARPPRQGFSLSALNLGPLLRVLMAFALIGVLGVGTFVGVRALLDNDDSSSPAPPATESATALAPPLPAVPDLPAASPLPAPAAAPPAAAATPTDTSAAIPSPSPADAIITPADLGGAPVELDRGGAMVIPAGIPDRTLADGTAYDPTDAATAFSTVWAPGTVLDITRLPGGPQLSPEDTQRLIGKTIRVTVRAAGNFPTEIQLSPAAFGLLALEAEPIIAIRVVVVDAPAP